jgi:uroporphyrinogen-III decarboxylase
MQYIDNPETVKAAIRYETRKNNALDQYFIRDGQDGVAWGQDFASSQQTFISPAMFREFALPGIRARVENVHDVFHLPVFKHACGNNNAIMDMFVEAGYDVYQSIQESAGMKLGEIKARYGRDFACMGGVRVETLVSGTPEETAREVRHAVENYKDGGRWIFGSSHSIAVGTRYDNFRAMVDQFVKHRDY